MEMTEPPEKLHKWPILHMKDNRTIYIVHVIYFILGLGLALEEVESQANG